MSSKPDKSYIGSNFHLDEFDFNEWKALYENDPDAFEKKRQKWVKSLIQSAPSQYQRRLKGLMFQVDAERARAKTPVQACINISQMMWSSTADLKCFLEDLACQLQNPKALEERKKYDAVVLNFKR